jgi:hypothetical protein
MVLVLVIGGGYMHNYSRIFLDLPSFLLILVSLIFFFITSKTGNIIGKYIKSSFKKNYPYSKIELKSLSSAIKNTIKFIFGTGGFGFIAGSLTFFQDNKQLWGPNISLSIFSLMYAITISCFVFLPVKAWAENKINTLQY